MYIASNLVFETVMQNLVNVAWSQGGQGNRRWWTKLQDWTTELDHYRLKFDPLLLFFPLIEILLPIVFFSVGESGDTIVASLLWALNTIIRM